MGGERDGMCKFEILNPKSETNSNYQIQITKLDSGLRQNDNGETSGIINGQGKGISYVTILQKL